MNPRLSRSALKLKNSDHVEISPNGSFLAQKSTSGGKVSVWNLNSRSLLGQFKVISNEDSVAFSVDEAKLAVKNKNGDVAFCNVATGSVISKTSRRSDMGGTAAFSLDGCYLFDGSNRGELIAWEVSTGAPALVRPFPNCLVMGVYRAGRNSTYFVNVRPKHDQPGGTLLLRFDGSILDVEGTPVAAELPTCAEDGGWKNIGAFACDERTCIAALDTPSEAPCIVGLSIQEPTFQMVRDLQGPEQVIWSVALGRNIVAAVVQTNTYVPGMTGREQAAAQAARCNDHLHFFERESLEPIAVVPWDRAFQVAFHPSGSGMAVASYALSAYFPDLKQDVAGAHAFVSEFGSYSWCEER